MSVDSKLDRVWDLIEKVPVCMLTTRYPAGLRARPLQPRADRAAGLIWFVVDVRGAKDDEIAAMPDVCLVFVDETDKAYLSITAHAEALHDRAKAAEIWRKTDDVWWPGGPDDPNARVLRVEPVTAELWDGPASTAVAHFEFVKARVTGEKPRLGENRKVTVKM
jgi:general stress protein 26